MDEVVKLKIENTRLQEDVKELQGALKITQRHLEEVVSKYALYKQQKEAG
ncbi:hypothetical protein RCG39_05035 [Lactococcus petauri]|nr:hypothetical protein [Lactococcus petauri]MDQ7119750.1 hypothetical protein [Lactococcus petauri]MDQ7125389.1 hypothetical protein [Lactococcus petauri]MDQ7126368.1 hypothetical protein [Lactococcus petauri]MDQ7128275.1 hypothetical protein [Lactococcus petauri]MDQ7138109.1 hypothetical protein [Lactococcus petauri]